MAAFPIDRAHPPRRVLVRSGDRTVVLRPWNLDDVDPLVTAIHENLAELRAFMPWAHLPVTREGHFEVLRRFQADYWAGRDYVLGIFSEAGELLGGTGLHARTPLNPNALEVGYWGHVKHAGQGNVTLAVRGLVALAFDTFGCDRLQVMHNEENAASRRVVERCGFVFESTVRNVTAEPSAELVAGGYRASRLTRMYSLCREDLASLAWLAEIRARLVLVDALGGQRA